MDLRVEEKRGVDVRAAEKKEERKMQKDKLGKSLRKYFDSGISNNFQEYLTKCSQV